jgi:nitroimidazol reductase NimA-like FMN-containing flavoprotein (pyridoxamine 5'-phosphate oxidase superfamily)
MDEDTLRCKLKALLERERLAVLATVAGDRPYVNLVAFVPSQDLKRLFFVTPRDTHKYANLRQNAQVSLLIDSRAAGPADLEEAVAVTAHGVASEVVRKEEEVDRYASRHPYLADLARSPDSAMICIDVQSYQYVSHFQRVSLLRMVDDAGMA